MSNTSSQENPSRSSAASRRAAALREELGTIPVQHHHGFGTNYEQRIALLDAVDKLARMPRASITPPPTSPSSHEPPEKQDIELSIQREKEAQLAAETAAKASIDKRITALLEASKSITKVVDPQKLTETKDFGLANKLLKDFGQTNGLQYILSPQELKKKQPTIDDVTRYEQQVEGGIKSLRTLFPPEQKFSKQHKEINELSSKLRLKMMAIDEGQGLESRNLTSASSSKSSSVSNTPRAVSRQTSRTSQTSLSQ